MSVGFLHTPNFAAFWPKPRKKKDSGTMCWYHANSSPPYPPPCRCQAPVQNRKKHREIERFWDNVLVSCKQFSTLPPLQMSGSCPKTEKKHREIERFCPKPKKTSRNRKKTKKTKDSGTMFWYHVNILLARLVFLFFFDFGHLLLISRCF